MRSLTFLGDNAPVSGYSRPPLARRERLAMASIILLAVVVTTIPYVYGLTSCPPDKQFLGLLGPYGNDQAFYLGWGPKQAEAGNLLFEDKYNGRTETRLVFNSLWLAMGWTARASGSSVLTVFQLERIGFSMLLLAQAYGIISRFVDGLSWRMAALLLVAFSSGFGVLGLPFADWTAIAGTYRVPDGRWTPDLWVAESNVFLCMLGELVLPAATALLLMTIRTGIDTFAGEHGSPLRTGLLTLLLGTVYPYAVLSVWAILGGFATLKALGTKRTRPSLSAYLIVVAVSCPIVLYDGFLVLRNPQLTTGQALYASPGLLQYVLGFGVVSLFVPLGAALILRQGRGDHRLLLVWIVVTFVQIYIPRSIIPFQLQLILGVQIPLVTTAVYGVSVLWRSLPQTGVGGVALKTAVAAMLVALVPVASATSVYHVANVFAALQRRQLPEYVDRETAAAIGWLARNTRGSEVVLSAPEIAPYIPVLANNRVYCGDYAAPTADFAAKQERIARMLRPETEAAAVVGFLREAGVDYVFYDSALRRRGGEGARRRLASLPELEHVFENASVTILRVSR